MDFDSWEALGRGNAAEEEPQAFDAYKLACRVNANAFGTCQVLI